MKPFGSSCIFVSCSSPLTGFVKLSVCTSIIPGTEKLLFFPLKLTLISTNCGSRKYLNVLANNAKGHYGNGNFCDVLSVAKDLLNNEQQLTHVEAPPMMAF
jgi:hypothetical protein